MPETSHSQSVGRRPVHGRTAIAAHLDVILASGTFKGADSLKALLRFTVHEALAGRGEDLKEYVLGATVLRKGESFDPKADGIVRVQMRRLRERLQRYYEAEGSNDPLRIEIPKGAYTPAFVSAGSRSGAMESPFAHQALPVGRDVQLAEMRAKFVAAAAGQGSMLCLCGEPGIGKTTVVEAFLRELDAGHAGCAVGRGRCSERLAGSEAYLPLLEGLGDLLLNADDRVRNAMSAVAPGWYARVTRGSDTDERKGTSDRTTTSQEHLKRELVTFVHEVSSYRPVVMFLDDLHWADASTVDVLAYWAARCRSQRALIIGAYRPAELLRTGHPFVRVKLELQSHGICHETMVPLLTPADLDRYLEIQCPGHAFPPTLSARIHEKTEGNPLFMADLVRFLRDRGVLVEVETRWRMVGDVAAIAGELPESVRSLIEKKIGDLSDVDRTLVSVAAVQGQAFDAGVVAKVLGTDETAVEERLESLDRTHGFVRLLGGRDFPDGTFTLRYAFVHVLYQNALYASVRPTAKAAWSAAVAKALVDRFGGQCDAIASELALLYEAAREYERAADWFLIAARHAASESANTEAVVLARRGLETLRLLPETRERWQRELHLQTMLGPALMSTIGYGAPEVEAAYVRARELCRLIGEMPQLFTAIYGLYQYWLARADYRTCRELAEQLTAIARKADDDRLLIPAHTALGNTLCFTADFDGARRETEQLMARYVPARHHSLAALYSGFDPGVASTGALGVNLWALGYPDQAARKAAEAVALARTLSHVSSIVLALLWSAMLHQHRREPERTREHAEEAIALAVPELTPWLAWATVLRGWAMAMQGEGEDGIAHVRTGLHAWTSGGLACLRPFFLLLLAESEKASGYTDRARSTVVEALTMTERTGEGYAEAELHRLRGELQPDPEVAERAFRHARAIARRHQARSRELRACVSLARSQIAGRQRSSHRMLAEVFGWFSEGFDTIDLEEAAAALGKRPVADVEKPFEVKEREDPDYS
jgi:predicted ATPase